MSVIINKTESPATTPTNCSKPGLIERGGPWLWTHAHHKRKHCLRPDMLTPVVPVWICEQSQTPAAKSRVQSTKSLPTMARQARPRSAPSRQPMTRCAERCTITPEPDSNPRSR
jgi:hypothetical protein